MRPNISLGTFAIALALAYSGAAIAEEGVTRAQVKAERAEAVRTGDIQPGDRGLKLNEVDPARYPAPPIIAGKTRAQVRAELAEAVRTGETSFGDRGSMLKDITPGRYPIKPTADACVDGDVRCGADDPLMLFAGPTHID